MCTYTHPPQIMGQDYLMNESQGYGELNGIENQHHWGKAKQHLRCCQQQVATTHDQLRWSIHPTTPNVI